MTSLQRAHLIAKVDNPHYPARNKGSLSTWTPQRSLWKIQSFYKEEESRLSEQEKLKHQSKYLLTKPPSSLSSHIRSKSLPQVNEMASQLSHRTKTHEVEGGRLPYGTKQNSMNTLSELISLDQNFIRSSNNDQSVVSHSLNFPLSTHRSSHPLLPAQSPSLSSHHLPTLPPTTPTIPPPPLPNHRLSFTKAYLSAQKIRDERGPYIMLGKRRNRVGWGINR